MTNVLYGNEQSNQLNARADKSQLYGLQGNDMLTSDVSDTFELNDSATQTLSAVIEDLNPSEDKIVVNFDGNTAPQLTSSISGSDVVWRDGNGNFNLTLKGVRDNDYFDGDASDEAWEVLRLTNVEREAQRLSPLTMADGLTNAAQIRAEEISTLGESGVLTDHTRPDGSQWSTVLDGKYNFPGENLDGGATSPEQVISDWMNSTAHRANILNTTYKKLGVGYNYYDIDKSDQRYYWTQLFADRLNNPETVTTANLLTANPAVDTVSKFITLTEDDDIRSNSEYGATIHALGGNDSISNSGLIVSISGGNDNDTVDNRASFATINAGTGNDSINLAAQEDTLSITGDEYTPATVGNNIVVAVGDGSINLAGAANLASVNIDGTRSKVFILTEGDDTFENTIEAATIAALGGKDFIDNHGDNVSINGGAGDDSIDNYFLSGSSVTIDGGIGNDFIDNLLGNSSKINGGDDNDTIHNSNSEFVTIDGGDGNDSIYSSGSSVTIDGGEDNDTIYSSGSSVTIDGGDGNDSIYSWASSNLTINAGAGDDSIHSSGSSVTIDGGDGNDSIFNDSDSATILGGADNDYIILARHSENQLIKYAAGDGSDTVENFSENSILSIEGAEYFAHNDGNDIVVDVDTGSIRLLDAATLEVVKINDETLEFGGEESKGKAIILSDDPDTLENTLEGATIQALGGDDSLTNTAANVLIDAGMDDDQISLSGSATNNLINHWAGNDTVTGFNDTATLEVYVTDDYSTQTSGNDVLVNVDTDSITLKDAADLSALNIVVNWSDPRSVNNLITLSENHDNCSGEFGGATLEALDGNDSINNSDSDSSTLYGGAGNDSIYNWDSHSLTINGGTGDDTINSDGENILFVYNAGDGNDIIEGFNETSMLSIAGGTYSSEVSGNGNDLIITVGDGSIILRDAATLSVNINNEKVIENIENDKDSILIESTDGDNNIKNSGSNVTINAGAGDDTIDNRGSSVTIDAGAGDDSIYSWDNSNISINGGDDNDTINSWASDNLTILGGDGDDSIHSSGSSVTIDGGIGDDFIYSSAENNVSINAGDGKDTIDSSGDSVTIDAGTGDDSIRNWGANATINGGADNDYIYSNGINNTILGGDGDDTIDNNDVLATISGGAGNDSINNVFSDSVSIDCGVGNDTIYNASNEVTINGGTGNDFIENGLTGHWNEEIADYEYSRYKDILYKYSVGDGNDTIVGFDRTSTLNILEETSLVSSVVSGDDVIIKVGDGSITLKDYRNKPIHIIIGESGLSGGSSNDNSSSNSNSSSGGGGRGGNDGGGRTSGGTSSNEGRGSDASGGRSAVGSSGSQNLSGISGSSGRVSTNRKNASSSAATRSLYNEMTATNQQPANQLLTPTSKLQTVYIGGNQVISNYQSGEKIIFGAQYTGAFYDAAGNFFAGSSTGAFVVENALDKVIDLSDAAGNNFVKAYAATTAGVIDGRNIAGFELINGSSGADWIYAGDGGSQMWGGADVATDILVGGNGEDSLINNIAYDWNEATQQNESVSSPDNSTIDGGNGNDYLQNQGANVSISGGAGNDFIRNIDGNNVSINGGAGNDNISNSDGSNVLIDGGAGNDEIFSSGSTVTINGGAGNDYISNYGGSNVSILAGTGNDQINLANNSQNNFISYADGDGNDTVWDITGNDTLHLLADESLVSSIVSGDDIIFNVSSGSVLLIGARNRPPHVVIGESGTSSGGSGSGGSGSSGSGSGGSGSGGSGSGGSDSGGQSGDNTSGGTSANEGNTSAASGGRSAVGSSGSQTSTGISSGGGRVSRYVSTNRKDSIASAASRNLYNEMTATNQPIQQTTAATAQNVYTGGNQVISDYTPDKKIFFCEIYTGAFYDGAGNFFAGSSTGALAVENAMDKVIDLRDAAGNDFVKAYAATTAGVIDGRATTGFELITGSSGADAIYAGDGGSQLWGGADVATDILVGGGGSDIFIVSKYQGSDLIVNASSRDMVYLSDANLSDIIATEENNGVVAVAFNTGNVVAVQSSEALSSTFLLNDGSQYRYNHANKSWQTA